MKRVLLCNTHSVIHFSFLWLHSSLKLNNVSALQCFSTVYLRWGPLQSGISWVRFLFQRWWMWPMFEKCGKMEDSFFFIWLNEIKQWHGSNKLLIILFPIVLTWFVVIISLWPEFCLYWCVFFMFEWFQKFKIVIVCLVHWW